ncbi:MAG: hypothetical protein AAF804_02770 [Bacteroidota bacterium]
MEDHRNPEVINTFLRKISEDQLFAKSARYTRLLAFLTEQSLAGHDLKEHSIGVELFEQQYRNGKGDGIVRVYMYNLRKKLKAYYAENGKEDAVIFSLKKGSYNLTFAPKPASPASPPVHSPKPRLPKRLIAIGAAISATLILGLVYPYLVSSPTYCWEAFLEEDAHNLCVLADQVILFESEGNKGNLFTKAEINSLTDLEAYKRAHPEADLHMKDFTFFTKAIPYGLQPLSRWFYEHGQDFSPVPESEFRFPETKRNHIIYLGQFKTMSVSKEIFLKDSKVFALKRGHFVAKEEGEAVHYWPEFGKGVRSEYAMVSYFPLNASHQALYFVSDHDIGTIATVSRFVDSEFLRDFYQALPRQDAYFNALFRVEGISRTDISCELVKLEILEE